MNGKFGIGSKGGIKGGLETVEDEYASPHGKKPGLKKSPSGDSSLLESDFDEDNYEEAPAVDLSKYCTRDEIKELIQATISTLSAEDKRLQEEIDEQTGLYKALQQQDADFEAMLEKMEQDNAKGREELRDNIELLLKLNAREKSDL